MKEEGERKGGPQGKKEKDGALEVQEQRISALVLQERCAAKKRTLRKKRVSSCSNEGKKQQLQGGK